MTEKQVVAVIASEVSKIGSLRSAAAEWGISPAYLSNVIRGENRPGESVLKAIGYERVTTYRRVKT